MEKYPKIQTVYLRDPENNYKTLLEGQFARPEFEYLAENEWIFTEKIHGTNIRVTWIPEDKSKGVGALFVRGRTEKAQVPVFLEEKIREMLPKELLFEAMPDLPEQSFVTFYGEGYGAKIQKGGGNYIPGGVSFILFDIKIDRWWLKFDDVQSIARQLQIQSVPIIKRGTLRDGVCLTEGGFPSQISEKPMVAEGLVMRPPVDLFNRGGERIMCKIKHGDFWESAHGN
jgi:hypothetical protein